MRLGADGSIKGYTHENEASWSFDNGRLRFNHRDGYATWLFHVVASGDGLLQFQGVFQPKTVWAPVYRLSEQSATSQATKGERLPPSHRDGIRRIQVGCGPHHLRPHWWNTDLRQFGGIDEALDATKPWPYEGILDYVYGEHFLEHLEIDQAIDFLIEAGRALRPGGRIRLSTPALEWVIRSHYTFQTAGSAQDFTDTLNTNRAFYGWGHKFLYSKTVLERLLKDVGYEDVRFFGFGQSDTPDLHALELNGHANQPDYTQWIIEGERGATELKKPEALYNELWDKLLAHVRPGH